MADGQSNKFVTPAPIFYGRYAALAGKGSSPQDFWDQVDAMHSGMPAGASDSHFIQQVGGYLKDNARDWFKIVLKGRLSATDYAAAINNWGLFGQQFKLEFFDIRSAKDEDQHWIKMKQGPNEPSMLFVSKVYTAVAKNSAMWQDRAITTICNKAPGSDTFNADLHAALTGALTTPELRQSYRAYMATIVKFAIESYDAEKDVHHTATVCSEGLKDQRLRLHAIELNKQDVNIAGFLDGMRAKDNSLYSVASKQQRTGANEISTDLLQQQDQHQEVAASAANQKKKKNNQKKNKSKGKPQKETKPTGPPKSPCMFCGEMHRHKECPLYATARRLSGLEATSAEGTGNE